MIHIHAYAQLRGQNSFSDRFALTEVVDRFVFVILLQMNKVEETQHVCDQEILAAYTWYKSEVVFCVHQLFYDRKNYKWLLLLFGFKMCLFF